MTSYAYEPLDYGKAQTRMVHLCPTLDYSAPIRISLKTVTLPRSCLRAPLTSKPEANDLISEGPDVETPDFIALSYVWGSPDDPQEVFVESAPDGACSISITRNLDTALRHIRMKPQLEAVRIWIDAICIDQGNIKERSHQVAFMDSIYTVARGTLIWLGPEEHDSERALQILTYLGKRVVENRNGNIQRRPDAPPRAPDEPVWESLEELPYEESDKRAIISLLERPWFTRLWIRQEIALATRAAVLCGITMTRWTWFRNGAIYFCVILSIPSTPADLYDTFTSVAQLVLNLCDVDSDYYRYGTLRVKNEGVRFTDPRDAIYGVKSLMSRSDKTLDVQPNYALEAAAVFTDVCVRIVERQGLTNFLHTCELSSISVPNLPSWVPDWSGPMTAGWLIYPPWSASGFISANATYLGDGVLRVSGILIDKIESIQDLYDYDNNRRLTSPTILVDYIWRCYPGNNRIDSPYDGNQSMMDAYCRTFAGDAFRENKTKPDPKQLTFDQAKEALKKIWSMDEDWTGYEDLKEDPLVDRFVEDCSSHIRGRCFFTTEDGYIGLAPLETQAGDIISVILGCQFPITLRKDPASSTNSDETRWKVVGACYANGLMSGEAIYGSLPSYYHPLEYSEAKDEEQICYQDCALLDSRTNDLKTDPSAVLEEFGIQPSAWSREPHRLEVSEPVLRAAGVDLRNFILV